MNEQIVNSGPAPELKGITSWHNSEPLTLEELKGKVVLIDFWTYSCINCIRNIPAVVEWYDKYKDDGLVVIGVHSPEFDFEKREKNVADSIKRFKINYPVAQDNNFDTWLAYENHYWPAKYLVDRQGNVVYKKFGEGDYEATEKAIQDALGVTNGLSSLEYEFGDVRSPEMYLGSKRIDNLTGKQKVGSFARTYSLPADLKLNEFALEGKWKFSGENVALVEGSGKLKLNFFAGKVHLVMESEEPVNLRVVIDGSIEKEITVQGSDLYTLFESSDYSEHELLIEIPDPGIKMFAFTFG
ncbi:thioredoxin family protein [Candidatus Peregrinibacteria bacterium]|nr:thioredoxin family protein [Candidatus Peregrinibacteria bacterium]